MIASYRKPDERRLAIHPDHFSRIDPALRARIYLEHGYGEGFDKPDAALAGEVAGFRSRQELMESCDVVLLPKPVADDLRDLPEGSTLWGWPHCVQSDELTQVAIDRRQTLIAWEAMHHYTSDGTSASTCSTRTTSSRATARSCTRSRCGERPARSVAGGARP